MTATADSKARSILEDCFMEVAEIEREADETAERTKQRAREIRERCATVWKMAGLGEPPEYRVEREIKKRAG